MYLWVLIEERKKKEMEQENKEVASQIPPQYDLNAKWEACLDLGLRRFVYSSFTGAFTGLLLFRQYFSFSLFSFNPHPLLIFFLFFVFFGEMDWFLNSFEILLIFSHLTIHVEIN